MEQRSVNGEDGRALLASAEVDALLLLLHNGWTVTVEPPTRSDPPIKRVIARRSQVVVSHDQREQARLDQTLLTDRETYGEALLVAAKQAEQKGWTKDREVLRA